MTEEERLETLHQMLAAGRRLAAEDDPVLDDSMPRVVAILHDVLRLMDLDYL
ncbi:MAG: hypothetical protein AB1679_25900 [Actinomycetota bacterium]|jgi:ribosome assembly protein YihI (activator of Der GTPase)